MRKRKKPEASADFAALPRRSLSLLSHPDNCAERKNRSQADICGIEAISSQCGRQSFLNAIGIVVCITARVGLHRCPILLADRYIIAD